MNAAIILNELPPYNHEKKLMVRRQDTYDIIRDILRKHKACAHDYDRISEKFWKGNLKDTCRELYNFCKQNIKYSIEGTNMQTSKTPAAILEQGKGDCKHYSLFIIGVLHSLQRKGYPVKCLYRFASYKKSNRHPKHVFAVAIDNGNEIWVDPVLDGFDKRDPAYYYKLDKIPPMGDNIGEIYDISGIGSLTDDKGNFVSGVHWLDTMPGSVGKAGRGKAKFKKFLKKVDPKKLFLKANLAPIRNAFLLLLKMNLFDFAYSLSKAGQLPANRDKIKRIWEKFGGRWKNLAKNINQGVRVYEHHRHKQTHFNKISGPDDMGYTMGQIYEVHPELQNIGVIQFAGAAAIIATATPIILAFKNLLKAAGIDIDKILKKAKQGKSDLADAHNNSETDEDTGETKHESGVVTTGEENPDGSHTLEVKDLGHDEERDNTPAAKPGSKTPNVTENISDTFNHVKDTISNFYQDNKKIVWGGVGLLVAVKVGPRLLDALRGKKTRRR